MSTHIKGPLYFERMGRSGPAMVFLHPNPFDQSSWIFQMAHLSTWCQCIAIDLPGYGRSPKTQPGLTLDDVAAAIWETIDANVAGGPVILVGCSVGSVLIPYLYAQRPTDTTAVVLTGLGYPLEKRSRAPRIEAFTKGGDQYRWRFIFEDFSPSFRSTPMAHFFADMMMGRNDTGDMDSVVRLFEALGNLEPDLLPQIACPALIVNGTEDQGHERAVTLQSHLPDAEFRAIPGAGHACYVEQPGLFNSFLIEFLEKQGLITLSSRL